MHHESTSVCHILQYVEQAADTVQGTILIVCIDRDQSLTLPLALVSLHAHIGGVLLQHGILFSREILTSRSI